MTENPYKSPEPAGERPFKGRRFLVTLALALAVVLLVALWHGAKVEFVEELQIEMQTVDDEGEQIIELP